MIKLYQVAFWATLAACAGGILTGCGSDGTASIHIPVPNDSAVHGTVRAPNGQFAALDRWWFWMDQFGFVSRAYASLDDELQPVRTHCCSATCSGPAPAPCEQDSDCSPDTCKLSGNVAVSLVQIDPRDATQGSTVLAKRLKDGATNEDGQFDIAHESLNDLNDASLPILLVQVGTPGSTLTRAFVLKATSPNATPAAADNNDIDAVSEAVVRVVLDRLTKPPAVQLSNFPLGGLMDISNAVHNAAASASGATVSDVNESAYQLASNNLVVKATIDNVTGVPVAR